MKKQLLILFLLLTLSLQPSIYLRASEPKYPSLIEGAYYIYNVSKLMPLGNTSFAPQTIYLRYYDVRYEVLDVNDTVAVIKVNHTIYINGTPVERGGYISYVFYKNLRFFKVFFDVTNINETVQIYARKRASANGTYTIRKVKYNFGGRTLTCLNVSYENYGLPSFGYVIISIDYGLILERLEYRIEYWNVTGVKAQQLALTERMVLRATNLFFLLYRPIIVISIIIIAVIVAVIIRKRKVGKVAQF